MICNALIIGVQKAGTTSIHNWLSQHPEVNAPFAMKDFHFFNDDEYYKKGNSFFESFFDKKQLKNINLAGAVNYIFFSETAEKIRQYNKDIKLILCLRHPVDRAVSAYKFNKLRGLEQLNFKDSLKKEQESASSSELYLRDFTHFQHGLYYQQIEKYLKVFPKEQIKVVFFDDIKSNPQEVCREVFKYLNIDSNFVPEFQIMNESGVPKSNLITNLLFKRNVIKRIIKKSGLLDLIFPLDKRIAIRNKIRFLNTDTKKKVTDQTISPELLRDLQSKYKEDIEKLEELLNINLEHWKNKYK